MTHRSLHCISLILTVSILAGAAEASDPVVKFLTLETEITPVSMEYLIKAIRQAEEEEAECLVIMLDTPGGLVTSMEGIIEEIFRSKVPVIVYVGPSGASSGSAGVFITMSAHISAMAPATIIGAAHPVTMGAPTDTASVMDEKVTNYLASKARAIAEERGKNVEWAERAVRESESITASEALELNVIDLIAPSLDSLLAMVDGREVKMILGTKTLNTRNARIEEIELPFRFRFLGLIVNPNIAYILMMVGLAGVTLELYNPGSIFPGVIGAISLILAFFAMQTLPVNYAGLLLIILAVILFILEIKITSFGMLSVGGIFSLTIGSIMLFDSPLESLRVSLKVIIPTVIMTAAFFLVVISLAIKAQKRKPTTGKKGLIGETGVVQSASKRESQILLHGELWRAASDEPLKTGDTVEVISVDRLAVFVKKVS